MTYICVYLDAQAAVLLFTFFRTPTDTFADLYFENAYSPVLFKLQVFFQKEKKIVNRQHLKRKFESTILCFRVHQKNDCTLLFEREKKNQNLFGMVIYI